MIFQPPKPRFKWSERRDEAKRAKSKSVIYREREIACFECIGYLFLFNY